MAANLSAQTEANSAGTAPASETIEEIPLSVGTLEKIRGDDITIRDVAAEDKLITVE